MTIGPLRLLLLFAGATLGVAAAALATVVGPLNVPQLAIFVAIGWSFVAAGVVAWVRRSDNPIGPLMTLTGVVYLSRDVMFLQSPLGDHLNAFLLGVFLALIAHQLVVYPHGTVRSRTELLVICTAYVLAVVGYVGGELFNDPRLRGCRDCSRNLLLVFGNNTLNSIANDGSNALAGILGVTILAMLVRRWRSAG